MSLFKNAGIVKSCFKKLKFVSKPPIRNSFSARLASARPQLVLTVNDQFGQARVILVGCLITGIGEVVRSKASSTRGRKQNSPTRWLKSALLANGFILIRHRQNRVDSGKLIPASDSPAIRRICLHEIDLGNGFVTVVTCNLDWPQ